jgi:hypothetical protein
MPASEGRIAYETVADELGDSNIKIDDLDEEVVKRAYEYALRNHKKWPPKPTSDCWGMQIISINWET